MEKTQAMSEKEVNKTESKSAQVRDSDNPNENKVKDSESVGIIELPPKTREKNRNPAYFLNDGQLLDDILQKSQKIVKSNFELNQKLFENTN